MGIFHEPRGSHTVQLCSVLERADLKVIWQTFNTGSPDANRRMTEKNGLFAILNIPSWMCMIERMEMPPLKVFTAGKNCVRKCQFFLKFRTGHPTKNSTPLRVSTFNKRFVKVKLLLR